jgi:hypothetical protein
VRRHFIDSSVDLSQCNLAWCSYTLNRIKNRGDGRAAALMNMKKPQIPLRVMLRDGTAEAKRFGARVSYSKSEASNTGQ